MKQLFRIIFVSMSLVACQNNQTKNAPENTNEMTVEQSTWEILFDGTNFDQWRGYLKPGMSEQWSIADSAMVFTPGAEGGQNIITKNTYTSFELSLEWKIAEGGNSGIFWGVHENPEYPEAYQSGPEIQVLDNERHPDAFVGEGRHTAGALYDMIAPSDDYTNPAGQWNQAVLRIDQENNQGTSIMNGQVIVEFPLHGPKWEAMVAASKFADWPVFGKFATGHIGLQDHGDVVAYRNIKIKRLD
ncbi:MAG: glycosyl hydrolase [Cryomorphaceae bacterium BACL21 MAG-121220-bin10]|jgi:hypothetical protein|nr:MAG: glycosyl hydrolase [Cryomorphaceae bacterium BACL21 MAG-121220-bin10]|tara:strand:- start:7684 stop:8415 length:732 start_codon:yes stop_codon:yes gene_type:complete